jgi:hypothetical protein
MPRFVQVIALTLTALLAGRLVLVAPTLGQYEKAVLLLVVAGLSFCSVAVRLVRQPTA